MLNRFVFGANLFKNLPAQAKVLAPRLVFRPVASFSSIDFSYNEVLQSSEEKTGYYNVNDDDEHFNNPEAINEPTHVEQQPPHQEAADEVYNSTFDDEVL